MYPSSDGEPMAETQAHVDVMTNTMHTLRDLTRGQPHLVAANILWYFEEDNPTARRSPDVMVVKDVGSHLRDSFITFRENNAIPCLIFEMTSKQTWMIDTHDKLDLYRELGVREYFLFDPTGEILPSRIDGFRLSPNGEYLKIRPDAEGRLECREFGVFMKPEGHHLRFLDREGKPILTREEGRDAERKAKEAALREVETERKAKEAALKLTEDERKAKDEALREVENERQAKEAALKLTEDERKAKEAALKEAEDAREQAKKLQEQLERIQTLLEQQKKDQSK
jgi:Uma2 family endonuclease